MKGIISSTIKLLTDTERRRLGWLAVLNVLVSLLDIASLASLIFIASFYTGGSADIKLPAGLAWCLEKGSIFPIAIFLALFIIKNAFGYFIFTAHYTYSYKVASRLSELNLRKYLDGPYAEHVNVDTSVYVRKILYQPIEFCQYILSGLQQAFSESVLILFTVIVVLVFNAKLFLLLAIVLLPPVFIVAYLARKKLKKARASVKENSEKALQRLNEALGGYIESNVYDKGGFFTGRYMKYQQQMVQFISDVQASQGISSRVIEVFAVLGLFVLVVANKFMGGQAAVEVVNIGAFMAAAYKVIPGIVKISNIVAQVKTHEYTIAEISGEDGTGQLPAEAAGPLATIEFDGVSFSHKGQQVIEGLEFEIAAGSFIGISGRSGKGKTTFIKLLLGFLEADKGRILVNGQATTATERQAYWHRVSYVQQRPFLLHDTISANVTLSGHNIDEQRLQKVIGQVGLADLVAQSPERLNKLITENGKNISGGQRQRIAIARALYKDADLIILDEPFSELDTTAERLILATLKELAQQGKMIILISHNKSSFDFCTKTYFI